ncbi:MAG: LysR substrate-binding domain-containing protein [Bacteroidales bacterium]
MDYRDIVFIKVAENLNFSRAANDLCISQPAVTKHIKELESKYRTDLFERKGNKVFLTEAGSLVYSLLNKIQQQYRDLDFQVQELGNRFSGDLVIGASSTLTQYVIPKVMASFHKKYPDVRIHLINGNSFDMEQSLLSHKIDLALVENVLSLNDIRYKPFLEDELIVVTGSKSKFAYESKVDLKRLSQMPMVMREQGSGTLEVIKKVFKFNDINFEALDIVIHLGSTESIKNFLVDFEGIGILSEKSVRMELASLCLKKIEVVDLSLKRDFRIALKKGYVSRQARIFIEFLKNYNF